MAAAGTGLDLGQSKKVGFIDDSADFLRRLEAWQRRREMAVYITSDVGQCLTWVDKNEIDTLVADLRMPTVDGIVVLEKARKLQPLIETIILTGFEPTAAERRRAERCGIKIYGKDSIGDLQAYLAQPVKSPSPAKVREMENRLKLLELVHREWAADLVSLLKDKPEFEKALISSADGPFTVRELIEDIEELRPRGVEYVRLWRRALLTLLRLDKRKNA
jgi:CheY-like chemotaxis protein